MKDPAEIIQQNLNQDQIFDNIEKQEGLNQSAKQSASANSYKQKESKDQMVQRLLQERQSSKAKLNHMSQMSGENLNYFNSQDVFSAQKSQQSTIDYMVQSQGREIHQQNEDDQPIHHNVFHYNPESLYSNDFNSGQLEQSQTKYQDAVEFAKAQIQREMQRQSEANSYS